MLKTTVPNPCFTCGKRGAPWRCHFCGTMFCDTCALYGSAWHGNRCSAMNEHVLVRYLKRSEILMPVTNAKQATIDGAEYAHLLRQVFELRANVSYKSARKFAQLVANQQGYINTFRDEFVDALSDGLANVEDAVQQVEQPQVTPEMAAFFQNMSRYFLPASQSQQEAAQEGEENGV